MDLSPRHNAELETGIDAGAVNYILGLMDHFKTLKKQNIPLQDEKGATSGDEIDPLAAYYASKLLLRDYYKVSQNIQ